MKTLFKKLEEKDMPEKFTPLRLFIFSLICSAVTVSSGITHEEIPLQPSGIVTT